MRLQLYFLIENGFFDGQTRALFVDTSSYNPALNIFAVVRVLFEFTPTGASLHRTMRVMVLTFWCRNCVALLQRAPAQAQPVRHHR